MFRIARSKLIQTISSIRSAISIYWSAHVRWPARPAELRAGLDFFGSFCIQAKEQKSIRKREKLIYSFFCLCKRKKQRKAHRQ